MKQVGSTTRLELQILTGPREIICQGEVIKLDGRKDAACLVMITCCGRTIMSEHVVAVTLDITAFLVLLAYCRADGGITLHRDIA